MSGGGNMQKKRSIICLSLSIIFSVSGFVRGDGTSVLSDFQRELNHPDVRKNHELYVVSADIPKQPLRQMYKDAYDAKHLQNHSHLQTVLDRLWWQGADSDALFRILRTRQIGASHPERDGDLLTDKPQKIFQQYYALSEAQRKKINPIPSEEMPDFLYDQAKKGYFRRHTFANRFFRVPTLSHSLFGLLLQV